MNEFYRMKDLATRNEHKAYTDKHGNTRKAKPAKQGLLPVAESTIWQWVRNDKFPKPVKLGNRITAWKKQDVDNWIQGQTA